MRKGPSSEESVETRDAKRTKIRYMVELMPDSCWIAHDKDDHCSGFLLFNKLTGTYHAWTSEIRMQFPNMARGGFKDPDDCPVDELRFPRADLLMLLALRHRFKEHAPGGDLVARGWRELVFRKRCVELEKTTGKIISEENWKRAMEIARDDFKFEKYAGEWLVSLVQDDRAADILIRFGTWLKRSAHIESETIEPHYQRFFDAVAAAATAAGGIPTQSAVKAVFEKGMSANQLGGGTGFRSTMKQLDFNWLPAGKRGKSKQQKKSGIISRT